MNENKNELCLSCKYFDHDEGCLALAKEFTNSPVLECESYQEEEK